MLALLWWGASGWGAWAQQGGITRPFEVVKDWVPVPSERFDIVFNRTFLAGASTFEEVPLNQTSGTTGLHFSFNVLLNPRYSIRVQPGVSFVKFNIEDGSTGLGAALSDTLGSRYKLRLFYAELPVLLGLSFRDDTLRLRSLLEVGLTAGYRISTSLKAQTTTADGFDQKVRQEGRYSDVAATWRIGALVRFSYRFAGLMVYYRLTDIWRSDAQLEGPGGLQAYPQFPPLEIGLSFNL